MKKKDKKFLRHLARVLRKEKREFFFLEEISDNWFDSHITKWVFRLFFGIVNGFILGTCVYLIISQIGNATLPSIILGIISFIFYGIFIWLGDPDNPLEIIEGEEFRRDEHIYYRIAPVEDFKMFSLNALISEYVLEGFYEGVISGIIGGGVVGSLTDLKLLPGVTLGLISGIVSALISGCFSPVNYENRQNEYNFPNAGTYQSLENSKNVFFFGTLIGIFIGFVLLYLSGTSISFDSILVISLSYGFLYAIYIGGGLFCIKHFMLRAFLIILRKIPPKYADFLDKYSRVENDYLQTNDSTGFQYFLLKIGSGYIFFHETYKDYFAELE